GAVERGALRDRVARGGSGRDRADGGTRARAALRRANGLGRDELHRARGHREGRVGGNEEDDPQAPANARGSSRGGGRHARDAPSARSLRRRSRAAGAGIGGRRGALFVVLALLVSGACSQVPLTGRSQLLLVSDAEMAQLAKQSRVKFLQEADKQRALVSDADAESGKDLPMVNRVAARIVKAAALEGRAEWRVYLVRSAGVNANASADGTIVVYTGILPVAQDEAGLAVVLGHEVAHVVARHSGERVSQVMVAQGLTSVAAAFANPA